MVLSICFSRNACRHSYSLFLARNAACFTRRTVLGGGPRSLAEGLNGILDTAERKLEGELGLKGPVTIASNGKFFVVYPTEYRPNEEGQTFRSQI
jgi:hypothetical protein